MCLYIKCFKKLENDPFVYHVHSILFVSPLEGKEMVLQKTALVYFLFTEDHSCSFCLEYSSLAALEMLDASGW